MLNILLGAKYIATKSDAKDITFEHLCEALLSLQPISDQGKDYFQLISELVSSSENSPRKELFTKELLEKIASAPRIPYSSEVYNLLYTLEHQNGIDTSTKITEPFISSDQQSGLYKNILSSISELRSLLKNRIFDQNEAVEAVSDAVVRMSWSKLNNRPRAIFSFLGPPATGKTYMAQLMGQGLQGYALKSLDMTQYTSEKEGFALVGLRKGFTDAGPGLLTEFIKENPKSIIVFDEIEKSHTRVQTSLLRMLSEGALRDEYSGDEIDCRECIVVFTSNLGSSLYTNRTFTDLTKKQPHQARENLIQVISQEKKVEDGHQVSAIPAELMSRLSQGSIVLFHKLSVDGLSRIAKEQILNEQRSFEQNMGLSVQLSQTDLLVKLLVLGFAPDFDTRAIKSRITDYVYDPITDFLLENDSILIEKVELSIDQASQSFIADQDMEALTKQLALKHQRIYFDYDTHADGNTLKVKYHNLRVEKLAKSDDFGDASGIQIDLPSVSFEQIAGHTVIKSRLKEAINLIKCRETLNQQGISPPKGMILYGVPGTGKTMLAKAFANEADLPFIACSGNDLLNEDFIKKLFTRAREYSPSIVFIDEIDALPRRGTGGAHADALVNRMLVEIDGFGGDNEIFIIAATNRKDLIDSAILRSGRIDLHYEVPQLDKDARRWFIEQMLEQSMFASDIDIEQIILLTAGFSGADLQKISRETILHALREGINEIDSQQLIEQINTQKYGAPLDIEDTKHHLAETAYHEAAHAVISKVLLPDRRIEQVTVVARADFLGMVSYDNEQQHDYTREFLFNLTCVALAGRAAQVKQFGVRGLDSGAAGDLKQASNYAWLAISQWGMDDEFYNLCIPFIQEKLQATPFKESLENRVKHWIDHATQQTDLLIEQNWKSIERVAERVLENEIIDEDELIELMEKH